MGIVFKGPGFYSTDSASSGASSSGSSAASGTGDSPTECPPPRHARARTPAPAPAPARSPAAPAAPAASPLPPPPDPRPGRWSDGCAAGVTTSPPQTEVVHRRLRRRAARQELRSSLGPCSLGSVPSSPSGGALCVDAGAPSRPSPLRWSSPWSSRLSLPPDSQAATVVVADVELPAGSRCWMPITSARCA